MEEARYICTSGPEKYLWRFLLPARYKAIKQLKSEGLGVPGNGNLFPDAHGGHEWRGITWLP